MAKNEVKQIWILWKKKKISILETVIEKQSKAMQKGKNKNKNKQKALLTWDSIVQSNVNVIRDPK